MDAPSHIRDLPSRQVHYLRRTEIDIPKWDRCVHRSPNGFIYVNSFFLDALCSWDALVTYGPGDEYEYIMPLPKKKKYGLTYSYAPPFTGQLGIVGHAPAPASITDDFLHQIPRRFLLVDAMLNEYNPLPCLPDVEFQPRTNLVLPLDAEYSVLYEGYTNDAKKNLRRTERADLIPDYGIPVTTVIDMYRNEYGKLNRTFTTSTYEKIGALCAACIDKGLGFTLGIRDTARTFQAAAFFGIDEKRIYYLLGAPGPEGRRHNAVHALIDEVIRKYAASGLALDFEGSDISSVAAFYRKFGPRMMLYHQVRLIRYPHWVRRLTGIPAPFPQSQTPSPR
jgi:hypothetical protein